MRFNIKKNTFLINYLSQIIKHQNLVLTGNCLLKAIFYIHLFQFNLSCIDTIVIIHGKNSFVEVFKNFTEYKSEKN